MLKRFFIVLAIVLAIGLVLCWIYLPAISRYHELKQEEEKVGKRIREIDAKIRALADEKYLLQNDLAYLEKVIREELGFVRPGEIIYEMVTKKPAAAQPAAAVPAVKPANAVSQGTDLKTSSTAKKETVSSSTANSSSRKIRAPSSKTSSVKRRPVQN